MMFFIKVFLLFFVTFVSLDAKEKVSVAIDFEYSPVTYKSFEGKPEGLFVDFWKLWAKKSGYDVEFKFYEWDAGVQAVKDGDVIFHSGLTPDAPWMQVSDEFYELKTSFYKLKNKKLPTQLHIGTIDEYYEELAKQKYPNAVVVKYKNYFPMLKDILNAKIDLIIDDEIALDVFLLQKGVKSNFETLGNSFNSKINAITNEKNKKYIKIFNKYLPEISLEELATIEDNILGKDRGFFSKKLALQNQSFLTKMKKNIPWILVLQVSAIGFFIFLFILWNNQKLKSMVKTKTQEIEKQKEELKLFNESLEHNVAQRTKELDEKGTFIASIINSSQDALIVIDTKSLVTMWNKSAVSIFGYSEEEMIGTSIEKIIPQQYKALHHEGIKRVSSGGEQHLLGQGAVEITGICKDGSIVDIDLSLNMFQTQDKTFYSANIRDISERKELANKLKEEEELVRTILDTQEQLIITTDGKNIHDANKSFLNFFAVKSIEEFQYNCICETFDVDAPQEYLQITMQDISWVDFILEHPQGIFKAQIKQYEQTYIFSVTASLLPLKGKLKSVVFTDITALEQAKQEVESINKHTKSSIEYASLIQGALVPDNQIFRNFFQDYFAIWHPKDTVGGDIYLFEELRHKDECLFMVIDCTGHGVPGAFVTMLVKAIERQIVAKIKHSDEVVSPANLLGVFNRSMKHLLKQEDSKSASNAGFDGGIIYYNRAEKILKFAGAETPLFYVKDNKLEMLKGNRYSVGYKKCDPEYVYKEHILEVQEGMKVYLTTDGYLDQNGGAKGFPFGKKRFQKLINEWHSETMADQQEIFLNEMAQYQDEHETNDDVTVIGITI